MIKFSMLIVAAVITTPANAQTNPVELWGNITSETIPTEIPILIDSTRFKSIKSKTKDTDIRGYRLSEDCEVHIEIRHPKGKANQVMIEWLHQPNCVDAVRGSLTAKYGEAVNTENTQGYGFNAAIAGRGRLMVWSNKDRTIGLFTSNDGLLTQLSYKLNIFAENEL